LFLGRPTSIKSSDLEIYPIPKQLTILSAIKPAGLEKSLETQIYEELLDLMELAGKIAEIRDKDTGASQDIDKANSAYLYVMDLDRQLQTWYRRLPDNLVWKPANIQAAPSSYFLLHQQYHCSIILLHRSWAKYDDPTPPRCDAGFDHAFTNVDDNHSFMSRSICTRQAIRITRIIWNHRQRFDIRRIFITGIQHVGTAATALIAAITFSRNVRSRRNNIQHLEFLAEALYDMSYPYQPAASMSSILQAVILGLQNASPKPPPLYLRGESVAIHARPESPLSDTGENRSPKKHQLSKLSTRPMTLSSSSTVLTNMSPNPSTPLGLGSPALVSCETDMSCGGDSVAITPRCERAAWPTNSDLDALDLDYPMMCAGMDVVSTPPWIEQEALSPIPENGMSGAGSGDIGSDGGNHELDFFSF
jgi:hypothetical protein